MRVRLVHGFTQTIRSWDAVEARLPRDWDVQALEVPDGLDFIATAAALGLRGGEGAWVGYSMGGRLALRLALDRPATVQQLVLVSATPGFDRAGEREARLASDERLASDVERDGVRKFLERWLAQPLFETVPPEATQLDIRTRGNTVHRLAHQLRALGQGVQEPLWDRLGELSMPVLVLTGAYDRKYVEIGERMVAAIGANAAQVTLPHAGHATHLERPAEVADTISSWLDDSTSRHGDSA